MLNCTYRKDKCLSVNKVLCNNNMYIKIIIRIILIHSIFISYVNLKLYVSFHVHFTFAYIMMQNFKLIVILTKWKNVGITFPKRQQVE